MCSQLLPSFLLPPGLTEVTHGLIGAIATVVSPVTLLVLGEALPITTPEGLSWTAWGQDAPTTFSSCSTMPPAEGGPRGGPGSPTPHSLHSSSSLLSPQSLTLSHNQKTGLQSLFLHVNW